MIDPYNVQRRRQSDAREAIDRLADPGPPQGARYKGRVFNGGSMPSAVPRIYLTHPVETSCPESEGSVPSHVVGTGSVPVLIVGGVPVVGDDVLARRIGGLWVARVGSKPISHCNPCDIPLVDLTATIIYDTGIGWNYGDPNRPHLTRTETLRIHTEAITGFPIPAPFWLSDCTSLPDVSLVATYYFTGGGGVPSGDIPIFSQMVYGAESTGLPVRPRPRAFRWLLFCQAGQVGSLPGSGTASLYQVGYDYTQSCDAIVPYRGFAPGLNGPRFSDPLIGARDIAWAFGTNTRCSPFQLQYIGQPAPFPTGLSYQDWYNPIRAITITRPA